MNGLLVSLRKNLALWIIMGVLLALLIMAIRGMPTKDWVITLLRSFSAGAVIFLVASGFSLIFGLLDVLNLAHGTLFMIGAYLGWTVFVRPDTFVDLLPLGALLGSGFMLGPVWESLSLASRLPERLRRILPWMGLAAAVAILLYVLPHYPITAWDLDRYDASPVTYAYLADQGLFVPPEPEKFEGMAPALGLATVVFASLLATLSLTSLTQPILAAEVRPKMRWQPLAAFAAIVAVGLLIFAFNDALTNFLLGLNTTWLFFIAMLVASLTGFGLGALMESTLIRPLYSRPIYQLMLTLGLSAMGIELVRAVWGRPEFTMPKPALFSGSGDGCPATTLAGWLEHQCSTLLILDGRVRVYNEIFIPLVGILVLLAVWILLKRSRLGMIIRAGVQDRQMVEALGINVKRVFTLVFGLGVGLAALGGVLAGPSTGLGSAMGDTVLLNALIALAIGGLTSYPGAAIGSLMVGLLQQFIIKYGAIGIPIPFTDIVFKPTPPLVPASTVLLMVIILLVMPNGLLGKKE